MISNGHRSKRKKDPRKVNRGLAVVQREMMVLSERVPSVRLRSCPCQEDENEGEARALPIPDVDTCLHRLRQSRPTNQTQIPLSRCTNQAGLASLLSSLFLSSLLSFPLDSSSLYFFERQRYRDTFSLSLSLCPCLCRSADTAAQRSFKVGSRPVTQQSICG